MDKILQAMKTTGKTAFRTREYAALLGKPVYARLVLHRLKIRGELIKVKNGWWAFPESMPEAIASEVSKPAYVSFHSALAMHKLTMQIPKYVQMAVTRRAKKYEISGMGIREYKIKNNEFGGFYRREGILLASPEKAFADSLNYPRACPEIVLIDALDKIDIEEVKKLINKKSEKRLKRLIRYAKQGRIE